MSLEQKNEDKWINVDPRTKKLSLRFRVSGFSRQFYVSTGLKDTKRNREIVRSKRDAIANDIALERFDPTLEKYQFRSIQQINPAALPLRIQDKPQLDLQQLWEKFTDFQSSQLEQTTILSTYRKIASIIRQSPTRSLNEAPRIRDWLLANFSHFTAWANLTDYSRCCKWACESKLITCNPFEKLQIQKPKMKYRDCKAFTLDQRDLVIESFEQHLIYRHYAPLVKFLFWTGARPGEAFALTWGDISPDCRRININKSQNFKGIKKCTKNGKQRVFPIQEDSKLHQLLMKIKPNNASPTELIFSSKTGRPINSDIFILFWKENRAKSNGNVYRYLGVVAELADQGKLTYLKPYGEQCDFVRSDFNSQLKS